MMCPWNNCQKEQQEIEKAQLTDEDRKSCQNKDFSKQFACEQKLTLKKGLLDKFAMQAHCNANKCPQVRNFMKRATQELKKRNKDTKKNLTLMQHEECMKKNCSKIIEESDRQFELADDTIFECNKKFTTDKEQLKCTSSSLKTSSAAITKKFDCMQKYCESKSNSNKRNTKRNNKNTKKH